MKWTLSNGNWPFVAIIFEVFILAFVHLLKIVEWLSSYWFSRAIFLCFVFGLHLLCSGVSPCSMLMPGGLKPKSTVCEGKALPLQEYFDHMKHNPLPNLCPEEFLSHLIICFSLLMIHFSESAQLWCCLSFF